MIYPNTYSVESVTSGHPDKVCDQISDAILDACLAEDPESRVAVESFGGHNLLVIGGEITSKAKPDYENIARDIYKKIGYESELKIITNVSAQSPDIAQGVDTGGAGDQGIMYGFATNETDSFLPKGLLIVHELAKGLEDLRKSNKLPWLRPDGKTQLTVKDGEIKTILISTQHSNEVDQETIRASLIKELIFHTLVGLGENSENIDILTNPTGQFIQGGFDADTGLTGRKIMVDTYGGAIPQGGGCFSGKDPSKVDRSAAYMCRFVAKNLVAAGLAKECLVSVAYAIGKAEPLMIKAVDEDQKDLTNFLKDKFDFRPRAIIERLGLKRPIYLKTAAYGHFGKKNLPWEELI